MIGDYFNGKMPVSKTGYGGSIPSSPAIKKNHYTNDSFVVSLKFICKNLYNF